jgi:hypothetical protein
MVTCGLLKAFLHSMSQACDVQCNLEHVPLSCCHTAVDADHNHGCCCESSMRESSLRRAWFSTMTRVGRPSAFVSTTSRVRLRQAVICITPMWAQMMGSEPQNKISSRRQQSPTRGGSSSSSSDVLTLAATADPPSCCVSRGLLLMCCDGGCMTKNGVAYTQTIKLSYVVPVALLRRGFVGVVSRLGSNRNIPP